MGKKRSSNKPSKAGQASRTANNKLKYKKLMTEQYVAAHGSEEGMPNWDEKPDFTPRKERIITEMIKKGKVPKNLR